MGLNAKGESSGFDCPPRKSLLRNSNVPETKINLGKNLNPANIREGSDVYFDCLVDAEPPVYKVEWKHNGKQLNHNVGHGVIISNQSLVLQGVSRTSAGNYSCVGFNTEGDGESKSFFLNVLFAPTCKPNQTRVHGVAKQERANISCQVDANPPQVTFRWTFNNSAETMEVDTNRIIKRPGSASVVTYTPMTELDYGTLLCWASNRIGHQRTPCVYHIIAAGKPDTVHNCSVSNASLSSVTVRCAEGFNGGLPQSFVLEVRDVGTQTIAANLTSPLPRFTVHGLGPGQDYQASVFAYNVKGRSEPVILQTTTLRLPEKQLTSDKGSGLLVGAGWRLTPVMMVVVGVAGALFLVACLVAGLLRLQCSREDSRKVREQQNKQNSPIAKAPTTPTLDSDPDRNPDVIPNTGLDEEEREFLRKRQLVSTIETRGSPTRSLLHHPYPAGYCTLRNGGLPLQDLSNIPTKPPPNPQDMSEGVWSTTLPRQWPNAIQAVGPLGGYQAPMPRQPMPADSAPQTPLVQHKRESQV